MILILKELKKFTRANFLAIFSLTNASNLGCWKEKIARKGYKNHPLAVFIAAHGDPKIGPLPQY